MIPILLKIRDWDGRSSIAGIFFGEMVFPYSTYIKTLEIAPSHSSKLLLAEAVRAKKWCRKSMINYPNF